MSDTLREKCKRKIYVASSWRNGFQPSVVAALREDGHEVYDFKDAEGFHWTEVDANWQQWTTDIPKYLAGLNHPCAERGFNRDMSALRGCDVCVYVMPCGPSASMEMGWAVGAGKKVAVYIPALREPDLMVKMAHLVTGSLDVVRRFVADPLGAAASETDLERAKLRWARDGEWVDVIEDVCGFGVNPPETLENTAPQLTAWMAEYDNRLRAEKDREADVLIQLAIQRTLAYAQNPALPLPTVASVRAAVKELGE